MNQIIPINPSVVSDQQVSTVNARDLHQFLESKQDYSTWIKNRIGQYKFMENQDFIIFHKFMEKSGRGRPKGEYHLTLDMAKELSMVERNDKGRQARRYFIECEKIARNQCLPQEPSRLKNLESHVSELSDKYFSLLDRHANYVGKQSDRQQADSLSASEFRRWVSTLERNIKLLENRLKDQENQFSLDENEINLLNSFRKVQKPQKHKISALLSLAIGETEEKTGDYGIDSAEVNLLKTWREFNESARIAWMIAAVDVAEKQSKHKKTRAIKKK